MNYIALHFTCHEKRNLKMCLINKKSSLIRSKLYRLKFMSYTYISRMKYSKYFEIKYFIHAFYRMTIFHLWRRDIVIFSRTIKICHE